MSRAKPLADRVPNDAYETPTWCVEKLLDRIGPITGSCVDPCAGHGAIIRACLARSENKWDAYEIRPDCLETLSELPTVSPTICDTLALPQLGHRPWCNCVMNPPYRNALEWVRWGLNSARLVIALLRLNWLASVKRADFLSNYMPSRVLVLSKRPSFTGTGTDACEYAWMIWHGASDNYQGTIEVLQ